MIEFPHILKLVVYSTHQTLSLTLMPSFADSERLAVLGKKDGRQYYRDSISSNVRV